MHMCTVCVCTCVSVCMCSCVQFFFLATSVGTAFPATQFHAGKISQKSALWWFSTVNSAASWLLRIFTVHLRNICCLHDRIQHSATHCITLQHTALHFMTRNQLACVCIQGDQFQFALCVYTGRPIGYALVDIVSCSGYEWDDGTIRDHTRIWT